MNYSSLSCDELIRACAESGTFEAWEEFLRRFGRQISLVVWRVARQYGEKNNAIVEDLRQETLKKVCEDDCRLLREFNPHHEDAFYGMLKIMAANVAHDYFRARDCEKRGSGKVDADLDNAHELVAASYSAPAQIEQKLTKSYATYVLRSAIAKFSGCTTVRALPQMPSPRQVIMTSVQRELKAFFTSSVQRCEPDLPKKEHLERFCPSGKEFTNIKRCQKKKGSHEASGRTSKSAGI
jgi:hypothetical protein